MHISTACTRSSRWRLSLLSQSSIQEAIIRSAPARVNLLGEHTDYTGGLVLPMAIGFATEARIVPAASDRYSFGSARMDTSCTVNQKDRSVAQGAWYDYPIGVLRMLQDRGIIPPPFDLHLSGNVPLSAGLSSSASVEVATALAILAHTGIELSIEDIAVLCRKAENEYVHSPCGIMDQFVVTAAIAGHALMLHTGTLQYEHLPMNTGSLSNMRVVVTNSMVKHSVATGEYGNRHGEVMAGQVVLQHAFGVADLGAATLDQLTASEGTMSRESYLRCRHIISENARVWKARSAMQHGDATLLGSLMDASHASQRDDFACSCEEIDFLVAEARTLPGCIGSRLTGGGFGGCTVSLVQSEDADSFSEMLKTKFRDAYGTDAQVFLCDAVDGAVALQTKDAQ